MNKYVAIYNSNKGLFDNLDVIEGKTPKEALIKTYNKYFERLYGENSKYATIILIKGEIKNNVIIPSGKYQRLCFKEII